MRDYTRRCSLVSSIRGFVLLAMTQGSRLADSNRNATRRHLKRLTRNILQNLVTTNSPMPAKHPEFVFRTMWCRLQLPSPTHPFSLVTFKPGLASTGPKSAVTGVVYDSLYGKPLVLLWNEAVPTNAHHVPERLKPDKM